MKISSLKAYIKDIPDDVVVYMASDAEGNSFHELSEDVEYDFNGGNGTAVLYPLHDVVSLGYGYCKQCEHNHVSVINPYKPNDNRCGVCGQPVTEEKK